MTRITIDAQTGNKLIAAGETVELVDETGRVIGTFHPAPVPPYDSILIPPMDSIGVGVTLCNEFARSVGNGLCAVPPLCRSAIASKGGTPGTAFPTV